MDLNIYTKIRNKLRDFFTLQYPAYSSMYCRKGTAKIDNEGNYVYELQSDKNDRFTVKSTIFNENYTIVINDSKGEILNYDSGRIPTIAQDIELLPKKLPYKFKVDEVNVQFSYDKVKQKYLLELNWCKDESLRQRALDDVNAWADRQGFDLSKIEIETPPYCDGEVQ